MDENIDIPAVAENSGSGDATKWISQENSPEAIPNSSLNLRVPPNTPRRSAAFTMSSNSNQNNMLSSPPSTQIRASSPLQSSIAHQMDLYNSTTGLFGVGQNQNRLSQNQCARLPQGLENPYSIQPVSQLPPNYGFQPQQNAYYSPETLPQPGPSNAQHNSYSNLRHLDGQFPCPYGYNVMVPYPSLCAYCFPESQLEPIDYSLEDSRVESQGRQGRKRKGNEEGKLGGGNGRSGLGRSWTATSKNPEDEAHTDGSIDNIPIASRLRPRASKSSLAESESNSSSSSSISLYQPPSPKIRRMSSQNQFFSAINNPPLSRNLEDQGPMEQPTCTNTEQPFRLNNDNYDNVPMDIDPDIN